MARQSSAVEFNNFVAGLITEASPLNFPDNASLDESNFVLLRDGTRRRRLGIDFESDHTDVSTSIVPTDGSEVATQAFRWKSAGGVVGRDFIVTQVGREVHVFATSGGPVSGSGEYFTQFDVASNSVLFSFAVVDGVLVIATGSPEIASIEYSESIGFTQKSYRLKIRDLFGVEDVVDGVDITTGMNATKRPLTQTQQHIYNLRNQTWGPARVRYANTGSVQIDTIELFLAEGAYPSNCDTVTAYLYPKTTSTTNPTVDRFDADSAYKNSSPQMLAPRGFFIIDALSRGSSREAECKGLYDNNPVLKYPVLSLPADSTPGGAKVVAEYAGRIWYAGFSGEVQDGDKRSPKMSSYILFSKLVENISDLGECYQAGDPTTKDAPDLVDTDGGFIRIDGASGIVAMVNLGTTLVVFADNGVWTVQGGSDYGFSAVNYSVSKISNYGCSSPNSVVQVDNSVMYWADDGIYLVDKNQYGDWVVESLSHKTIQTFYENIDPIDRKYADGVYDSYERKVYWTYGNRISGSSYSGQLIFDVTLGAFYKNSFPVGNKPIVCAGVNTPPIRVVQISESVTVDEEIVLSNGDPVSVVTEEQESAVREVIYLTITETSPISFTFSKFIAGDFIDWRSVDGIGVDAEAYLLTGWMSGGDTQRSKQATSLTMHFEQTEEGFEENVEGDYVATKQSSCLVSAQWNWANSAASGKWGTEFQAYRLKRHFFVDNVSDPFNSGFYTVTTRNKLRGSGKVLSMKMRTEPGKDCHILGWGIIMSVATSV